MDLLAQLVATFSIFTWGEPRSKKEGKKGSEFHFAINLCFP